MTMPILSRIPRGRCSKVSTKLNGHDASAYLRDVLKRLPGHPNSRIEELLPHRWRPATAGTASA